MKKIELMHHLFGKKSGFHICKECSNFISRRYNIRILKKCKVYGLTHSQASDWANKYEACGMFNTEYQGTPIICRKKHRAFSIKEVPQVEGQISFNELEAKNEISID